MPTEPGADVTPKAPRRRPSSRESAPVASANARPLSWQGLLEAKPLRHAVDAVQYGVALILLVIAVVVLIRTASDFLTAQSDYPQNLISAIDGVLVVIIVVDVLRTVLTHFEGSGFPLQPFLIIGIISAVRDILSVSARLALQGPVAGASFERLAIELGVSSGVALALAAALVLTQKNGGPA